MSFQGVRSLSALLTAMNSPNDGDGQRFPQSLCSQTGSSFTRLRTRSRLRNDTYGSAYQQSPKVSWNNPSVQISSSRGPKTWRSGFGGRLRHKSGFSVEKGITIGRKARAVNAAVPGREISPGPEEEPLHVVWKLVWCGGNGGRGCSKTRRWNCTPLWPARTRQY